VNKISLLIIASLFFTGCAASNPYTVKYELDDSPTIVNEIPQSKARIFFYRLDAIVGCVIKSPIFLDGKPVGQSISGTMFFIDVNAGEHHLYIPHIKYSTAAAMFGGSLAALAVGPHYTPGEEETIKLDLINQDMVYLKSSVSFNMSGRTALEVVEPNQAKKEMEGLKLVNFQAVEIFTKSK